MKQNGQNLMHLVVLLSFVLSISAPAFIVSSPSFLRGWFTWFKNNPAFKCNKASLGDGPHENLIIEARIHSFENEHDNTYKGSSCDFLISNHCDLRVKAYIDTDTPLDNWPNNMKMTEIMHEWNGNDIHPDNRQYGLQHERHSFTACKLLDVDKNLSIANIHIAIEDVDAASRNDIVNHFNCHWAPSKQYRVGLHGSKSARWETINCCTAYTREMKSTVNQEMKIDIRAYRPDRDEGDACPADGRRP